MAETQEKKKYLTPKLERVIPKYCGEVKRTFREEYGMDLLVDTEDESTKVCFLADDSIINHYLPEQATSRGLKDVLLGKDGKTLEAKLNEDGFGVVELDNADLDHRHVGISTVEGTPGGIMLASVKYRDDFKSENIENYLKKK